MRRCRCVAALLICWLAGPLFAQGVSLPAAERIELENGSTLILVERHDVPLIGLEATIRGGAVADPADKHGLANLLAGLLEKGAGDRGSAAFAEAAEAVGGEISASADLERFSVSAEFMSRDAALMVELLADMLRRPTLDNAEFTKLRDRSINLIKAAKSSDPNNLLPAYANAFLFGEHAYGNPTGGSESSLADITHADLRNQYAELFGGNRLTLVAVGDFDTDEMRELLTGAFEDWGPANGELPVVAAPEAATGNRVYLIDKPDATQTYFRIGNVGVERGFEGRADLDLANTVFGGRFTSMLMTELRVKSGLSYTARSVLARHSQPGSVFISSFTETATTVEAIDLALDTLAQFRESGLSDEMILSARNYVMGQFPPQLETASQLAGVFATLETHGLDSAYINDYGAALSAATSESISAVIDTVYPENDALVFVLIGDAAKIREQIAKYGPITEVSIEAPHFHP